MRISTGSANQSCWNTGAPPPSPSGRAAGWRSKFRRDTPRAGAGTVTSLALVVLFVSAPRDARACGGLFCDGRPANPFTPLPVAQNGENVVFAIDKDPQGGSPTLDGAHPDPLHRRRREVLVDCPGRRPADPRRRHRPAVHVAGDRHPAAVRCQLRRSSGQCRPDSSCPTLRQEGIAARAGMPAGADAGSFTAAPSGPVNVSFQGAVGPYDAAVDSVDGSAPRSRPG